MPAPSPWFPAVLKNSGQCAMMVSEENEDAIFVSAMRSKKGKYCVVFDPLDGSSNIDCGVSIGTIFGIYRADEVQGEEDALGAVLRPGTAMVAAGYCMYGSCTELMLSTGDGVNGFTLDPAVGEFVLTHENIKVKDKGAIYSINEGNSMYWDEVVTSWINHAKYPKDGSKPMALRCVGGPQRSYWDGWSPVLPAVLRGGVAVTAHNNRCMGCLTH